MTSALSFDPLRDPRHRTLVMHRVLYHMIWVTLRDLHHVIDTTSKDPHFCETPFPAWLCSRSTSKVVFTFASTCTNWHDLFVRVSGKKSSRKPPKSCCKIENSLEIQSSNYYPQRIVIKHSHKNHDLYTKCSKIENILNTIDNIITNKKTCKRTTCVRGLRRSPAPN